MQEVDNKPTDPLPVVRIAFCLSDYRGYTKRLWLKVAILPTHVTDHTIILGYDFISKYVLTIRENCVDLKDKNGRFYRRGNLAKPLPIPSSTRTPQLNLSNVFYLTRKGKPRTTGPVFQGQARSFPPNQCVKPQRRPQSDYGYTKAYKLPYDNAIGVTNVDLSGNK